ncbi:MAG: DUF4340 domain-containing protein [Cyanothece sp. SIO2G6]|nr:DUF4340 domain-containing protein [Cyanothece sp. SIO2G6]
MKLQSPTLILVFVAVTLGGFVVALELFQNNADDPVGDRQPLFEFTEAEVKRLTLEMSGQELQFEKEGDEWQMQLPSSAPANEATVVFLANLMVSAESDRVFAVEPENLRDFGFSPPLATIEVRLENDDTHRLILGGYDFDRSNIYAQTESEQDRAIALESSDRLGSSDSPGSPDSPDGDAESNADTDTQDEPDPSATVDVFIVSPSFETAINRPLEDWLQREEPEPDSELPEAEPSDIESPDAESPEAESPDAEPIPQP